MKEKLEEAANRIYPPNCNFQGEDSEYYERIAYINGGTWVMEKMYSEEDMIAIVEKSRKTGLSAEYLLLTEQFKKK